MYVSFKNELKVKLLGFVIAGVSIFNSGCMPQDVGLNKDSLASWGGGDSSGFAGLTSAQTMSATKVQLTWEASTDPKVIAYNIYDSTLFFKPKLIMTVKAPTTTVAVTGLTPQFLYSFRVRTVTQNQEEDSNTNDKQAIPYGGIISAQVMSATSALIQYSPADSADSVSIYCKVGIAAVSETLMATVTDTKLTETTINNLTPGEMHTCRAVTELNGFQDNNLATISFVPLGQATQLVFTTQPGSGVAGETLASQPVVSIQDSNGNVITAGPDSNTQVTLTIATASPSLGTLYGTATVNAVKGVATFSGINFKETGIKILTATKADTTAQANGSGVLTADSNTFTISPGPVSATVSTIAITPTVPPADPLVADGNSSYSVVISLKDQYGNPISGIKPQFSSSISGDTLSQPTAASGADGVATGSISTTIADTTPPYRTLVISSPSGLSAVSTLAPFVPGPASKLSFTVQPINSPAGILGLATMKVAVVDVNGNIVNTGTGSNANITMTIASNVNSATLTGTTTVAAYNGVATFSDLGIDKTGTGYKLLASSGSYVPAYSNAFNVTSGTPQKIAINGASSVVSGTCSAAITIQLQDNGNNPANALQNTPVSVSGLGSASLYSSSACTGTALSSTITFTAGTNLKTVYLKDPAGEMVNLVVKDSSNVLTQGTRSIQVLPNKIAISALVGGSPMSVVAGACSSAIVITPQGDNGNAAPLFSSTDVAVTGLTGSEATLYSDASCTVPLTASSISLPVTYGGSYPINIYLKDPKAEDLAINVSDIAGIMTTVSGAQSISITPSNIFFSGPSSVVAGKCSSPFTITLKDAQGNAVAAASATSLNINGLASSTTGKFYTNAACSGGGYSSSLSIPQGSTGLTLYFSDTTAESLNIYLSDPLAKMANSQTLAIGISPAALRITGPTPASSKTTICAGPFTINTLDGAATPNITAAIGAINVNLTTTGYAVGFTDAAKFYSDSACSNEITSVTFSTGDSAKSYYMKSQYPITTLTMTATDVAGVLTAGSTNWTVTSAKGWLGALGKILDDLGNLSWFRSGVTPVSARQDAPSSVRDLHFDASKQFLYVVDSNFSRILKYDYTNKKYVGWIGIFNNPVNATQSIKGSSQATYPGLPSPASCVGTTHFNPTPGWCLGGMSMAVSTASGNTLVGPAVAVGGLYTPQRVTDDGTYIYVTSWSSHHVARYNAESGAFAGWIGGVSATPNNIVVGGTTSASYAPGALAAGTALCASTNSGPTPGWCTGGLPSINASGVTSWGYGTGAMVNPRAIVADSNYLYVGQYGAVLRYSLNSGAFAGWIGKAYTTAPTGGANGCTSLVSGDQTPGWCLGGTYLTAGGASIKTGGINNPTSLFLKDGVLTVVQTDNSGTITQFDAASGSFIKVLPSLAYNWLGIQAIAFDATSNNYIGADTNRVIAFDATGTVQGWLGKVSNNSGLSSALSNTADCSSLSISANTPGWCLGGAAKAGMEEIAFSQAVAIEIDSSGDILIGQQNSATIKKFDTPTGQYKGSLVYSSEAPTSWSNDGNTVAENYGFGDGDFYSPTGVYNDGKYLYVVDSYNARVKKIEIATGKLIGWIGAATTVPTGGADPACLTMNPMSVTPGWCTGAYSNPWAQIVNFLGTTTQNGLLYYPAGITGDGTYLYLADFYWHRIYKINASTGAFVGWIGNVSSPPTGGAAGCTAATADTFTPGWCTGGTSKVGTGDGMLNYPSGITYVPATGYIYVMDGGNHRVSAYNASTGAFIGWIGRTSAAPSSGCTPTSNGSYTVSGTGWCKGGTSQVSTAPGDRGGGFYLGTDLHGITSDGTYLYITNWGNRRIDKFDLGGTWIASTLVRWDQYNNTWTTNRTTVGSWSINCAYPRTIWTDGANIYGAAYNDCATGWGYTSAVYKIKIDTGTVVGWQGGIYPSNLPTGGEPNCAGATGVTPGWCQGGASLPNLKMGQFWDARYITGDDYYIYVTDVSTNRVTRIPK